MELVLLQLLLQYHFSYKEVEFLYAFTTSLKTQVKRVFSDSTELKERRLEKNLGRNSYEGQNKRPCCLQHPADFLSPQGHRKSLGKEKGPS